MIRLTPANRCIVCLKPQRKFIATIVCLSLLLSGFSSASMIVDSLEHNHALHISHESEPTHAGSKHHTKHAHNAQHKHKLAHKGTHSSSHNTAHHSDYHADHAADCCEEMESECASHNLICSIHCAVSIPMSAATQVASYHTLGRLLSSVTEYFPSVDPSAPFKPPRVW